MVFEIYHSFWFGEKRKVRKEGIKIKKVRGKELTYLLTVPDSMLCPQRDPFGGTMYSIRRRNSYFLGTLTPFDDSLTWLPGDPIGRLFA